ncbi:hypothetical protein PG990_008596 [Apiospora arundinis]
MASINFRFQGCGHVEKNAKVRQLWSELQAREVLPQELNVSSGLPCRICAERRGESQKEFYSDVMFWLDAAWDDDTTNDACMLAQLVWAKSALEDREDPTPAEKKVTYALLAMNATRLREKHMDALEDELLSYFAEGCNVLRLYLQGLDPNDAGSDRNLPSFADPLTEDGLDAFFFAQVLRFYNIGRKVQMVTATHVCMLPDDPPVHLHRLLFSEFHEQIQEHVASLEAKAGDLILRSADLANSLPIGSSKTDDDDEAATTDKWTTSIARPEDEQVRLVKGMERSVNHLIGLVISLRESVATVETRPWDLEDYTEWWKELPKRKILGLGIF